MLSIRDIRQRVVRTIRDNSSESVTLSSILALDPLTILRLMRMARAPVNNIQTEIGTIGTLIHSLGSIVVKRALEVEVTEIDYRTSSRLRSDVPGLDGGCVCS